MVRRVEMLGWLACFELIFSTRKWKNLAHQLCMLDPFSDNSDGMLCEIPPDEWRSLVLDSLRKLPKSGLRAVKDYYAKDIKLHETVLPDELGLVPGTICTEKDYAVKVLNFLKEV